MNPNVSARRVLALVCAVGLLAGASAALADDDSGYLGVMLQDIDASMAKALQLGDETGVLVSNVVEDSPAAAAGLEDGDVILEFDGKTIDDGSDLTRAVRRTAPGDKVEIVVLRGGDRRTLEVQIGERDDEAFWVDKDGDLEFLDNDDIDVQKFGDDDAQVIIKRLKDGDHELNVFFEDDDRGYMGVHLDDLNKQLGEYFDVEDGEGALVTEVVADSPAAAAGLRAGDVIVKLGDTDITSAADLHEAMSDTEADQKIELKIVRKGKHKDIDVTLGEMPEDALSRHLGIVGDDGDYRVVAPKMMYRFPHMQRDMRVHRPGRLEDLRGTDKELKKMRRELDKMRAELDRMREKLEK
jgi:C-terminal processing protease CtpA/Prc